MPKAGASIYAVNFAEGTVTFKFGQRGVMSMLKDLPYTEIVDELTTYSNAPPAYEVTVNLIKRTRSDA